MSLFLFLLFLEKFKWIKSAVAFLFTLLIFFIILQTHKGIIAIANIKDWISLLSIARIVSFIRNDNFLAFDILLLKKTNVSFLKAWLFEVLIYLNFTLIWFFKCFFRKNVLLQS